jgi:spore coat polysaccharide biosynthesis protein SpsF
MMPLGDSKVINLIANRLQKSNKIDGICVATTLNEEDEVILNHFRYTNIDVFRGSDWNVLDRVLGAAQQFGARVIVEITGDCPFVDPHLVDYMLDLLENNDLDYIANNFTTSFADGFDVQVYYFGTLKRMAEMDLSDLEKEHVTMKIRQNPELFKTLNLIAPLSLRRPNYSITLDTFEDYRVIQLVYEAMEKEFGSNYGVIEITEFLDKHPEISVMNKSVQRRGYS